MFYLGSVRLLQFRGSWLWLVGHGWFGFADSSRLTQYLRPLAFKLQILKLPIANARVSIKIHYSSVFCSVFFPFRCFFPLRLPPDLVSDDGEEERLRFDEVYLLEIVDPPELESLSLFSLSFLRMSVMSPLLDVSVVGSSVVVFLCVCFCDGRVVGGGGVV